MNKCNHDDCFTCPYPDCIGERKAAPNKRGRKPISAEEKAKRKSAYAKQYYQEHKEQISKQRAAYYQTHKEQYKIRAEIYKEMRGK